jgi:hypothetical protein
MEKNQAFYEIVREDSKYNKYIKWFVRTYHLDKTLLSSQGVKTRKEAEAIVERMIEQGKQGFPIGDHLSFTDYTCIGA